MLALLTPAALATAAFGQVFSASPAITIPTTASVTAYQSTINVAGGPASISDLNVIFQCTHTWDSDLQVVLQGPTGYICLTTGNGSSGDNYSTTRFDGAAATSVTAGAAPFNGNFKPEGLINGWTATAPATFTGTNYGVMAQFNGTDSNGNWTMYVADNTGGDGGTWSYWSMEFNGAVDANGPAPVTTPSNPTFVASILSPVAPYIAGDTVVVGVTVSPGEGPNSTGLAVNADLSPFGGSPTNALLDNGVAPDAIAGDFIFTGSATIPPATPAATYNVPITVSDAQARTGGPTNLAVVVSAGGQGLPTATTDMGSIPNPTNSTGTLTGFASGSGVKWIKMTIPTTDVPSNTYLDIDTNGAGAGNLFTNSTIALYDNAGNRMGAQDTDDGASLFSMLSYGLTTPTRPADAFIAPATAVGLAHAGVDGASLPAGTYWLGVAGTGVTFQATNWRFTGTSTQAGDCAYHVVLGSNTTPTNPSGTGAIAGATSCPGVARLMTVTVLPGTNPASSGLAVSANLSAAGGSASQSFFDNGTNGDVTAGDNIWSYSFTPATTGAYAAMPFTITDAQSRSGTGNFPTLTVSACVSGLPGTFVDLGALGASPVADAQSYAAGQVRWYKFSVGAVADPGSYLDIWTSAGAVPGTLGDTEIALYDNTGVMLNTDDDDGDALYSAQSFGRVTPNRPAVGASVAFNGRDLGLAAGTYWLAVCEFNAVFANNWDVQIATPADAGDVITNIVYFVDTQPTNPSGVGAGGVVNGCGGTTLATVTVTPGTNPVSSGIAVSLDTTSLGGGPGQAMFNNGTNGDVTAGDNTWSLNVSVAGGADAVLAVPFSITDAESRSGSGSLNVTRSGTEIGDLPATAKTYYGSSGTTIASSISSGTDVDMYAICVADTANFEAGVNNGGASFDTQLFLFNADGTGAAMNDDEPDVAGTLQSHMMLNNSLLPAAPPIVLPSGGLYYLAISPYNRDPITSGIATDLIWNNTATTPAGSFDATWAPNGATPTLPVVGWTNTGNAGGTYTITMVGASTVCPADLSSNANPGKPDCAVDINDLLYFLVQFEAGNIDVSSNGAPGVQDCATDINDLLFFLVQFEGGC